MMVNGRGGPADPRAAIALFEKAAAQGHSGAMFALGAMHSGGHNLPIDRVAAQRWFRAAAELGHGHAQWMLARYLASGAAAKPNPVEARHWLERAIEQGLPEAEFRARAANPTFERRDECDVPPNLPIPDLVILVSSSRLTD